jgi:hypothetical protein
VPVTSVLKSLRLHSRVAYQGFFTDDAIRTRLVTSLPDLVTFKKR